MAKVNFKGGALLAPLPPVLVSCGSEEDGDMNIMTVAWTGILNTQPPKTYISVRPSRYSYGIIKKNKEFVLNLTTASLVRAADYCGIYTGERVNKFEKCRLTPERAQILRAPLIAESPLSIECRVTDIVPLGTHDMFIADIVSVSVSEEIIDEKGRICLDRAELAAYAHGEYFALGRKLGAFGFSAKKKKRKR
ncbi:MAG: flavin reductase family protein [Eubacteriales bacterium]